MRVFRNGFGWGFSTVLIAAGAMACAGIAAQPTCKSSLQADAASPGASEDEAGGGERGTLKRVLCRYDFEEAARVRTEFPLNFRNLAEERGYPKFGTMRLTDGEAFSGDWSFRFDVDGTSLAAGIPWGVLPVLPGADYMVSVRVRTLGLKWAQARLTARLFGADRKPLPETVATSEAMRTGGMWRELQILVPGRHPDAAWLAVELELLQPGQSVEASVASARPVLADYSGSAWFDDLVVWHLPRIEFTTNAGDNIIVSPASPQLRVLIVDVTNDPLMVELRVRDLAGRVVFSRRFPAPRGRHPLVVEPGITRFGWYRAELDLLAEDGLAAATRLGFALVPDVRGHHVGERQPLSVVLPCASMRQVPMMPRLVRLLGVGGAVVSVWDEDLDLARGPERFAVLREAIERLLAADIDLVFALDGVPAPLAQSAGVNRSQVLDLLCADPQIWRPYLDELLVNFGLRVQRWQLGRTGNREAFENPELPALIERARAALAQFIPNPQLVVPFDADQELAGSIPLKGAHLTVPHEVQPTALGEYASVWPEGGTGAVVHFESLPLDRATPRQQTLDLLLRGLYGWRTGFGQMSIGAPWRWEAPSEDGCQPKPAFVAWRGLAEALRDRRFAGELQLEDGVHCWLLEHVNGQAHALVAWADQRPCDPPVAMRLVLGEGALREVDPFGNERMLGRTAAGQELRITQMPVFVEGIDLPLARFRAAFAVDPPYVPATHRLHEHEVVLRNPWDRAIGGVLRLHDTDDCRITPRRHEFLIRSHEEVRLPINIVFDRSVLAGKKRIEADVELESSARLPLRLHTDIEVGWQDIEFTATWRVASDAASGRRDLIISQYVRNRGERPVNLEAFLRAPGVPQNRRPIAGLQPDTTAVKTFRIADGANQLAGKSIRIGVVEADGIAQLNRMLTIPAFVADAGGEEVREAE